nr:transglutaminase domain-containing protein [Propionibacterium sp.]
MTTVAPDPRRSAPSQPELGLTAHGAATTLAAVALLLLPGVLAFGPVFGGPDGYLAAGGGVLLGLALGFLARWRRWALASTVAAAVGAYLLFGGALALRPTTIAGVVPTPDTLLRLVPLSVQAWRDLLTITPPANAFVGPAVVPYLSGLVLALVAAWVALDARRYLWALLATVAFLAIGILWGLDEAPLAAALGAGYGAIALLWARWRRLEARRVGGEEFLADASALGVRRLGSAAGVVALAAAAALLASPLLGAGADRHVLRRTVQPPLNLQDYASPLTSYRYLEVDAKDLTLFTVSGLPAGARVRLATMDAYDGRVYSVADASAGFVRIGERTGGRSVGTPATLAVTVGEYAGVWLPGGGDVRGVRFAGARAGSQADSLHFNPYGGTLLTTAGVATGDAYQVDLVLPSLPAAVPETAQVAPASAPALERVPDVIAKTATDLAGDAAGPLAQLRALETALRAGYYSNGADGSSRAGHTAERIASMLAAPQLVGDDEQYAVAMALMARQLGIPARVVLGFYPDPDAAPAAGPLAVTGDMTHAWVEVPFQGVGWLSFDPTPDRDRTPQTQVPQPKPNPKPQVLPPPDPPVNTVEDPLDDPGAKKDDEAKGDDLLLRIAGWVGVGVGAAAVVGGPFVLIGALKARRRSRRRNAEVVAARFSGGWAELVDAATDLGARLSPVATRRETAAALAAVYPGVAVPQLAAVVDAGVFGPGAPTAAAADALWVDVDRALASMNAQVGRWRRALGFCSLRSFGRPRQPRLPAWLPAAHRLHRKGCS